MHTYYKTAVKSMIVSLLVIAGFAVSSAQDNKAPARRYKATTTEREAISSISAQFAALQQKNAAIVGDFKARVGLKPDDQIGYDAQAGEFYVVPPPEVQPAANPPAPVESQTKAEADANEARAMDKFRHRSK